MSKFQVGDIVRVTQLDGQQFFGTVLSIETRQGLDYYEVQADSGSVSIRSEGNLELIPTYVANAGFAGIGAADVLTARPQITIGAHAAATKHLGELAGQELADALMNDIQELRGLPRCECGAHATSFQDNHSTWCPVFESRS